MHGVNERVICLPRIAALPPPLLLSFWFVLAGNSAGSFQHILSLSHWKAVSNGGDYGVKCVSFPYKAPEPHTARRGEKKRSWRRKWVKSSSSPHPTQLHACIDSYFSIVAHNIELTVINFYFFIPFLLYFGLFELYLLCVFLVVVRGRLL